MTPVNSDVDEEAENGNDYSEGGEEDDVFDKMTKLCLTQRLPFVCQMNGSIR